MTNKFIEEPDFQLRHGKKRDSETYKEGLDEKK